MEGWQGQVHMEKKQQLYSESGEIARREVMANTPADESRRLSRFIAATGNRLLNHIQPFIMVPEEAVMD